MSHYRVLSLAVCALFGIVPSGAKAAHAQTAISPQKDRDFRRSLQERKQQLEDRKATLENQRSSLLADRQQIVRLTRDLDSGIGRVGREKNRSRKWICNAYNAEHDDPSECSDPSKGGRWVSRPNPDADQAEATMKNLKQTLDDKQRNYADTLRIYDGAAKQLEMEAKQLAADIKQIVADGQRTFAAGSGGAGNANVNVDSSVKYLTASAEDEPSGRCATYVREALEAGGIDTTGHPTDAKGYGPFLNSKGFKEVPSANYSPQKGDIVVIQPYPGGNQSGHIAMYDDSQWVSDFKQKDFWGGREYRNKRPVHTFYRP